ncbi:DUF2231 domain-containing protein [Pedobacter sp. P351]|uniref:DUF2231 domain-containing protein n=1 Tax=Pedobacter superstes TaxID=3133441 RepID=UPI0030B2E721
MPESLFEREEIWHPLSVHFPVALLLFATIIHLIALFLKERRKEMWEFSGSLLLYSGSLLAWFSIYTGDIADGVVGRTICDPTVLKSHEIAAFTMAYLFTSASVGNLLLVFVKLNEKLLLPLKYLVVILTLAGSGYLIYTGHLGASLVYQQGAGVIKPSSDCSDF